MQYECKYKGIVAVSSREGRLLGACSPLSALTGACCRPSLPASGGNRTLAEAFQFKYGKLPSEFAKARKRKTIVGVGVQLRGGEAGSPDAGLFVISDVTAGGPAARAGVRPLERITGVDGVPSAQLTLAQVARALGGKPGETVTLTLRAKASGEEAPVERSVALVREEVALKPAAGVSAFEGPSGGLFSGAVGPKPPPALWLAMQGMREGGRRVVQVPSDVGYEDVGSNEIPPNADFVLDIELLTVVVPPAA